MCAGGNLKRSEGHSGLVIAFSRKGGHIERFAMPSGMFEAFELPRWFQLHHASLRDSQTDLMVLEQKHTTRRGPFQGDGAISNRFQAQWPG